MVACTVLFPGDFNRDGRVDGRDLLQFALRFGAESGEPCYDERFDLDFDGVIDGADLALLAADFGKIAE